MAGNTLDPNRAPLERKRKTLKLPKVADAGASVDDLDMDDTTVRTGEDIDADSAVDADEVGGYGPDEAEEDDRGLH